MFSAFDGFFDRLSCDLAIDLGSTNTLIFRKAKGIVLDEPSVVAVHRDGPDRTVFGVGADAKKNIVQGSNDVALVKPVKFGMVADFAAAGAMLRGFIDKVRNKWLPAPVRVIANVPAEATDENRNSVRDVIRSAGAQEVYLLEEPRALALGAGLDISEDQANMVLDIGGGITEMAVIVCGKIVCTRTIRIGGDHMDKAIVDYMKKKRGILLDIHAAEMAKIQAGEAYPCTGGTRIMIEGVHMATRKRRMTEITSGNIREALSDPLRMIIGTVKNFIQGLPAEMYVDILDRGIMLAGGGTLLPGIDRLLEKELMMPAIKSRDPLRCLVLGTGDVLEYMDQFRHCARQFNMA